jgi:hypothetical protein
MPEALWARRFTFESGLNDVLRTLDLAPYAEEVVAIDLFGNEARAVKRSTEDQLRRDGYKLLSARDRRTIKAGDIKPRPIYMLTPQGHRAWFRSIAAAARASRCSEDSIRRMLEQGDAYYDPCNKS